MRWRFWRRKASRQQHENARAGAAFGLMATRVPRQRNWPRLPALPVTIDPHPPAVTGFAVLAGSTRRPSLSALTPLRHRPGRRRIRQVRAEEPTGQVGRVSGLMEVLVPDPPREPEPFIDEFVSPAAIPAEPADEPWRDAAPAEEPHQQPHRTLPVIDVDVDAPDAPQPLTRATATYVGEPRVAPVPHRSSAGAERILAQLSAAQDDGQAQLMLAAGLAGFSPTESGFASIADLSPSAEAPPATAPAVESPNRALRRRSLAASRRLGLSGSAEEITAIRQASEDVAGAGSADPAASGTAAHPADDRTPGAAHDEDAGPGSRTASAVAKRHEPAPERAPEPAAGPRPEPEQAPPVGQDGENRTVSSPAPPVGEGGAAVRPRLGLGAPVSAPEPRLGRPQPPAAVVPDATAPSLEQARPAEGRHLSHPPPPPSAGELAGPGAPANAASDDAPIATPPVSRPPVVTARAERQPGPSAFEAATVTPVYRATLGVVPSRVEEEDPHALAPAVLAPPLERADTVEVVPPDVADFFHTGYGVDVTRVPVHRGPEVTRLATAFGARAFTKGAQVFLPSEAGDLSGSDTKALLAHELVHVTQQQFHGVGLPEVASPAGQGLEAAAVATEQWFRGERAAPPALIHRPAPEREIAEEMRRLKDEVSGLTEAPPTTSVQHAVADGGQDFVDLVRQEVSSDQVVAPPSSLPPGDSGASQELASWSLADSRMADRDGLPDAIQRPASPPASANVLDSPAWRATQARIDTLHGAVDELTAKAGAPAVDLEDPRTLDELAGKLYRSIRRRLRTELIVDSERTGMLSGFERS